MFLSSNFTGFLGLATLIIFCIVMAGLFLKKLKQPYIIGYILVGILIGNSGLGLIQNSETIQNIGELGLILLLFFVGMEINLPEFKNQWKISLIGTTIQILFSVLIVYLLGSYLDWHFSRIIVLGFVIALSSSAVIIGIIQYKGLIESTLGKNILSILLTQDILIAPMLVVISMLGGGGQSTASIFLLIGGAILFTFILIYIYVKKEITIPFAKHVEQDHELQVFIALIFCFGGALLSSYLGLSPALGSFIGGMVMHAGKSTDWIHDTLNSFRILFVSIFFIGIGLQINLSFIFENIQTISIALLGAFITNHVLNAIILRIFDCSWKDAILGGAYLAQIGELSFMICLAAFNLNIISEFSYSFTISLIAITLIISPFWIAITEITLKKFKM
ncbi:MULTISPECIES: cation:proton antiporter [unclassified Polaribacter]|uniref:cation:proton antiporter n=1 Tax=unclassified Polaribacter TaxID=196858 RepID=UPI0011BF2BAC|nr:MULTISPECIES: cation:proton antiporter [unclassified Polaribacter]TXD53279.1 cation:proton antiporter [Polaribacter sp. IC063]TXD60268.1 cation:proton antiporter [Polaribacter sp. IC066]